MIDRMSYAQSGVDINATDAVKQKMEKSINSGDPRVLNDLGAFSPLVEGTFPGYRDPMLVIKTDEPGSKQKLAFELGMLQTICRDLVHHTVNDVAVIGAEPIYVTDCIVCGTMASGVVEQLVHEIAAACRALGCVLIGGETSVQPGVVEDGLYVLSASVVGVVDRSDVIDGRSIDVGEAVLSIESNGLHTNGYTLVRTIMEMDASVKSLAIDGESFIDVIMRPHTCYHRPISSIKSDPGLHGLAHITGGGIADNLKRILPTGVDAEIALSSLRIPPVFSVIREKGKVSDEDMFRTFNLGVGVAVVCSTDSVDRIVERLGGFGLSAWQIGEIVSGTGEVRTLGDPNYEAVC